MLKRTSQSLKSKNVNAFSGLAAFIIKIIDHFNHFFILAIVY